MLNRQSMRLVEGRKHLKPRHAVAALLLFAALRAVEHHQPSPRDALRNVQGGNAASGKSVAAITFCHIQRGNSSDSAGVGMVKNGTGRIRHCAQPLRSSEIRSTPALKPCKSLRQDPLIQTSVQRARHSFATP